MEEDLELCRRWRDSRDENAFAILYNRHRAALIGDVRHRLGEQFLLREAHRVQEAMGEAWIRLEQVQNISGGLRLLLVTILRRLLIDAQRRDPSRREQSSDEVDKPVNQSPVDELIEAEDRDRLRKCLEQMPPAHQETYRLLFQEGLTLQQAAAQMGLASPSGAFAHREQMIRWLRECMTTESEQK